MLTPERIIEIFRAIGMNCEPSQNALYTVRGQHAHLIEGARAIEQAASQQQALEYTSLFDQCSEALDRLKALEAKCVELETDRDSWRDQASQRVADWDEMRKERDEAKARIKELEAKLEARGPVYDKSFVKRLAVQMGLIQAAEAAAIERCAKVCDEHLYAEKAAEAIRALLPKEES